MTDKGTRAGAIPDNASFAAAEYESICMIGCMFRWLKIACWYEFAGLERSLVMIVSGSAFKWRLKTM
ncbi:hypothetical protein PL18_06000 [Vibrio renipiscarius]|nr:hypothetical protein PL18_06000 [Vibrio renipiscarius]